MKLIYTISSLTLLMSGIMANVEEDRGLLPNLNQEERINRLIAENRQLMDEKEELEEKVGRMQSKYKDMMLAMTWKYEQLERKAQTYYNSFQTQKQNLGMIVNKYTEPARVANDNSKSTLIPAYLWSQTQKRLNAAKVYQAGKLRDLESSNFKESYEADEESSGNSDYDKEIQAPVARSFGSAYARYLGGGPQITLKSALSPQNLNEVNLSSKQTGRIPDFSSHLKKSVPSASLFNKNRLLRSSKRTGLRQNPYIKFKKVDMDSASDLFSGVNFSNLFKKAGHFVGGIRR